MSSSFACPVCKADHFVSLKALTSHYAVTGHRYADKPAALAAPLVAAVAVGALAQAVIAPPAPAAAAAVGIDDDDFYIVSLDDEDDAALDFSVLAGLLDAPAPDAGAGGAGVPAPAAAAVVGLGVGPLGIGAAGAGQGAAITLAGRLAMQGAARIAKFGIASTLACEKQLALELVSYAVRHNLSQAQHGALVELLRKLAHLELLTPAQLDSVPTMRSTLRFIRKLTILTDAPLLQSMAFDVNGLSAPLTLHYNPLMDSVRLRLQNPALKDAYFYHDINQRSMDYDPTSPHSHPWDSAYMKTIVAHELEQCRAQPFWADVEGAAKLQGRVPVPLVVLLSFGHDDTALGWGRSSGSPVYDTMLNLDTNTLLSQSGVGLLAMLQRGRIRSSEASAALITACRNAHQAQLKAAIYAQINAARLSPTMCTELAVWLHPPLDAAASLLFILWPTLALLPADHEGRAGDLAVIRRNLCVECTVKPSENSTIGTTFPDRMADTAATHFDQLTVLLRRAGDNGGALSAADNSYLDSIISQLETLGQRSDVQPAVFSLDRTAGAWKLPRGPFDLMPPDMLHTVLKGVVTYTLNWVGELVVAEGAASRDGAARSSLLNLRTADVPRFSNGYTDRRSFPDGFFTLSVLTASDVSDAIGVVMAAVGGDGLVIANAKQRSSVLSQLELTYMLVVMMDRESFSDADIVALDALIQTVKIGVSSLFLAFSASDLNFIKFHLLDHMPPLIRALGAPRFWNTSQLERAQGGMVKRHFARTNYRGGGASVAGQIIARQSTDVFCRSTLPQLLHAEVPPAAATIPEEEDFMLLRGKMDDLSKASCDVSASHLDRVAAAWPDTAAAILGDAYDPEVHVWDPAYATQFRSLRWRRRGVVDSSVQGHRTSVVSVLSVLPDTGKRTVHNFGDAATAYICFPEFFFLYKHPDFLASLPAPDEGTGSGLTDEAAAADAVGDDAVELSDAADYSPATSIATVDPRAMFMAFTWLKPTAAGSALAAASAPFQTHSAREPWDSGASTSAGLQLEPASVVFSKHRFFPFFRAPSHATVASALKTPGLATTFSSYLVSTTLL